MTQFFKTVPGELREAAIIDGAGDLRIYARVYLPVARPAIARRIAAGPGHSERLGWRMPPRTACHTPGPVDGWRAILGRCWRAHPRRRILLTDFISRWCRNGR